MKAWLKPPRAIVCINCLSLSVAATSAPVVSAQVAGDADCSGSIELKADVAAVIAALFTPTGCVGADANEDSRLSAPDVDGVLLAAAMTGVATPTPTGPVRTATPTPTPTATVATDGPEVTFFGLANADGCASCDVPNCLCQGTPTRTPEFDGQGRRVFETALGSGFILVVEGKPGQSRLPVGTFVPAPIPNSPLRPDLQIVSDHDLGDGGPPICEDDGGVPGIDPLSFDNRAEITDAMIDLACRFQALSPSEPCTLNRFGGSSVLTPGDPPPGSRQFCLQISGSLAFSAGAETLMAVRLADSDGNVGAPREIVVRVRQP